MQTLKIYFITFTLLCSATLITTNIRAETFTSGDKQNTLIELYTSEGCSSCPPAEKYLNSLINDPQLWKSHIPIALHVDYWDYLGWKDRFASPIHTQRQRQYARVNLQNTIYTPGFFVNGEPWRRGFFSKSPPLSKAQPGKLSLTLNKNQINAKFLPGQNVASHQFSLTVAVLGMGLKTSIKAGENAGHSSSHEFVNLKYVVKNSDNANWSFVLPKYDRLDAKQLALVAWVSKKGDPRPIQAVGGYIKR